MQDVMAGHVDRGVVPGVVTPVSRRGEVQVDAIGTKAFGDSDPMRRDTIFRVASVTKPIVAAADRIISQWTAYLSSPRTVENVSVSARPRCSHALRYCWPSLGAH
jgi:hypothetical protein